MHDRRFARGEDGQMLVIFSLCLVAIIAMTGLVIDGGMTFVQKREQQNVADAAALAGAYAYVNSGFTGDWLRPPRPRQPRTATRLAPTASSSPSPRRWPVARST